MSLRKTVTYDERNNGWTSFHSWTPEWMARIGTRFFTFKGGELYEHHVDTVARTTFYGVGYGVDITFVANESPGEVKLFKNLTLETESNNWAAVLTTDLESGLIDEGKFERFESYYSTYIRQNGAGSIDGRLNFNELSVIGIGNLAEKINAKRYRFANSISSNANVGDFLYLNGTSGTQLVGEIQLFTSDASSGVIRDTVQVLQTPNNSTTFEASVGEYMFVGKDLSAESRGIRGYYCQIKLTNDNPNAYELYCASTEAVKSNL
jgi:hypothetical protein|tara:strand:+ start:144 stop:935 length:792 start_codon:yes stop_codon:yes gene_type:complete